MFQDFAILDGVKQTAERPRLRRRIALGAALWLGVYSADAAYGQFHTPPETAGQEPAITATFSSPFSQEHPISIDCYGPMRTIAGKNGTSLDLLRLAVHSGTQLSGITRLGAPKTMILENDYGDAIAELNGIAARTGSGSDQEYYIAANQTYMAPARCSLRVLAGD